MWQGFNNLPIYSIYLIFTRCRPKQSKTTIFMIWSGFSRFSPSCAVVGQWVGWGFGGGYIGGEGGVRLLFHNVWLPPPTARSATRGVGQKRRRAPAPRMLYIFSFPVSGTPSSPLTFGPRVPFPLFPNTRLPPQFISFQIKIPPKILLPRISPRLPISSINSCVINCALATGKLQCAQRTVGSSSQTTWHLWVPHFNQSINQNYTVIFLNQISPKK